MREYLEIDIDELKPYENNARTHSEEQVEQIIRSIEEFGFINPIIIDSEKGIIAGHGRVMAAKEKGMKKVPCLVVDNLTEEQKKAYIIADNKLALNAGWDMDLLQTEIDELLDNDFDITLTGFQLSDFEIVEREEKDLSEDVKETFEVIIECDDEEQQERVYERLSEDGYKCRVLTL